MAVELNLVHKMVHPFSQLNNLGHDIYVDLSADSTNSHIIPHDNVGD